MTDFAWAIIGPGRIAHRFADAVHRLPGACTRRVLGRDAAAAAGFAAHWSRPGKPAPQPGTRLEELLRDPGVDAVYVATPHSAHTPFVQACLEAGKPVLCEKPLVPNLALARGLVDLARQRNCLLMEALWTRLLPVYERVADWLRDGAVGRILQVESSFCARVPFDAGARHYAPSLAGGALLDIGVYCVGMSRWVLEHGTGEGAGAPRIEVRGELAPTGVDRCAEATLDYPGDLRVRFRCGFDRSDEGALLISGEAGRIRVPRHFWEATEAVLERPGCPDVQARQPFRINGFEYQVEEAMRAVRAGWVESPRVPHAATLGTLAVLDELRRRLGVRYPFEPPPAAGAG